MQNEFRTDDPADASFIELIEDIDSQLSEFEYRREPIVGANGRQKGFTYILSAADANFVHYVAGTYWTAPDCD